MNFVECHLRDVLDYPTDLMTMYVHVLPFDIPTFYFKTIQMTGDVLIYTHSDAIMTNTIIVLVTDAGLLNVTDHSPTGPSMGGAIAVQILSWDRQTSPSREC